MNYSYYYLQFIIFISSSVPFLHACQFYPQGEFLRFVRVPENLKIGEEVLRVEVFPRNDLSLFPVDKNEDVDYFTYRAINRTTVAVLLAKTLEDLVDSKNPRNVLKFKLSCDYHDGEDTITSSLSITVYVEDINDHSPIFEGSPYKIDVDELFPVGVTLFKDIRAIDRDKPNTPNSDIQFAIIAGNERGKFRLESSHQPDIILQKTLDFDTGDRNFLLTITATDRGTPPRSTNTTVKIKVNDNDDLPPKFTKGVYRTKIHEFYPITGAKIHEKLIFHPPIFAFDQDFAIDTPIRYDIIAGNERHLFYLDHVNATIFLEKEIDLDGERSLPGNTFVLQIQASQVDNSLKTGLARVEIEIIDLNDNLPEFEVDFYNISIVENLPNGFSVLQILATDQDQGDNAEFSYDLEDRSGAFNLDARSGWLTVRNQSVLDREKRSTLTMRVFAKEKVPSVVNKQAESSVTIEVSLLDANDNNPTFIPMNLFDFIITTEVKKGDIVGQIYAIDPDLGRNGLVMYSLQKASNNSQFFDVDSRTGKIYAAENEIFPGKHLLFIEAADQPINPSERRTSLAVVTINVKNHKGNENYPEFIGAPYEFWVGSAVGIGTSVGQLRISDFPDKTLITFDLLHSYHEGVPFAVEEKSGVLTVVDELKKFTRSTYDFEGVVTNDKDLTLITNVTLHVVDPKDEQMILMRTGNNPTEFHVKENQPNALIGKLGFKNNVTNGLKFSIANQKDVTDMISISSSGNLHTLQSLDREIRDVYRLTVIAEYNKENVLGSGIYQVTIIVDDENDNKPMFQKERYEGKIKENCKSGTEVELNFSIQVIDKDIGPNGQFTVTIFGIGSEIFRLDKNTGKIHFISSNSPLDRETTNVYNLRLVAKDKGGLYSEAKLTIQVEDENDNAPILSEIEIFKEKGIKILDYDRDGNRIMHFEEIKFAAVNNNNNINDNNNVTKFNLTQSYLRAKKPNKQKTSPIILIPEDLSVGNAVIKLHAYDKDEGDNSMIKYEMISETYIPNEKSIEPFHLIQYFAIHSNNGELSVARALPAESEFRLNISASDRGNLKDYILVRILIKDVNDHTPVFKKSSYTFDAEEATYTRKVLGKVEAVDSDYGVNANISYTIKSDNNDSSVPFSISTYSGQLSVNGLLDRETKDKYSFVVVARDNPHEGKTLSSSVNVEVNVLDINDNPPVFYGYDDLTFNKEAKIHSNHFYQTKIPVYYSTVSENSPIGTPITKVFANDSDFSGNGNGLILFDIPFRKGTSTLFSIDSKEGIVTVIGKLDYENQKTHNITIIASDLGSPSLSATALLIVNLIDVQEDITSPSESPVFAHRYYEIEVEENVPVPLKILTINVTEPYRSHKLRYSITSTTTPDNKTDDIIKKTFRIDPINGSLFIVEGPDREKKALYELIVHLDQFKVGRDMMTKMVYPVTNERLGNLGLNEVKVIIRITDVNDNLPKFMSTGRPIVAAIPSTAGYGYEVMRLQATDPDLGINGEIRFQILSRTEDANRRFIIDSLTGQIRAIANFAKDTGKVFGFDVKATDRRGADDGHSTIVNVLVYVIDEQKQIIMVMGIKPTDVENKITNITGALFNATGLDVRVRKLEPHNERQNLMGGSATDMYLYAVDPALNTVIDMNQLEKVLMRKQSLIEKQLKGPKVLSFSSGNNPEKSLTYTPKLILSSLEIGAIILGCVVFIGALITALCVICIKRKRRRLQRYTSPLGYSLNSSKLGLYPSLYGEPIHRYQIPTNNSPDLPMEYTTTTARSSSRHDISCPRYLTSRFNAGYRERTRNSLALEKSITSLHSSGQDSGIADGILNHCQCGHNSSSNRSSGGEDTNSNYEDSLQSLPSNSRKLRDPTPAAMHHHISLGPGVNNNFSMLTRSRNRSITEDIVDAGGLRQLQNMNGLLTPSGPSGIFMNGPSALRRSTERLMMVGSMHS